MTQYIIAYFGGDHPETKDEGQKHMEAYKAWLSDLGDAVVSPMNPIGKSHFVTKGGVSDTINRQKMSGYTIVKADSVEKALEMAKACPFVDINGTLEVAELKEMG